jgi:hypothetical protein
MRGGTHTTVSQVIYATLITEPPTALVCGAHECLYVHLSVRPMSSAVRVASIIYHQDSGHDLLAHLLQDARLDEPNMGL